jgi:hypothetical protein
VHGDANARLELSLHNVQILHPEKRWLVINGQDKSALHVFSLGCPWSITRSKHSNSTIVHDRGDSIGGRLKLCPHLVHPPVDGDGL